MFHTTRTCLTFARNNSTHNILDTIPDFPPKTEPARGNAPSAATRLLPAGVVLIRCARGGGRRAKGCTHACNRAALPFALPSHLLASRACAARACSREFTSESPSHTRSVAIKKWKNAPRIPVRILGVTHARARARWCLRVARARCEMVRAHTHTATCRSVYTHIHAHITHIHAHIMRLYARWWLDALHPVSRLSSP